MNNENAVPHILGFYEDPFIKPGDDRPALPFLIKSVSLLFDIRKGVGGFIGTAHGGLIGAMMDDAMGTLIFQNDVANREAKAGGRIPLTSKDFTNIGLATTRLDVTYHKPVPLPAIVVVTAYVDSFDGRKAFTRAVVTGEKGKAFATGKAEWTSFPKGKL
jgi:acyl-coenzyme A thioesterase PaaI-like protein